MQSFWSEARIIRLQFLWSEDWSCKKIAADLGCSRGAVIGKADRLNLPARGPKPRMDPDEARKRRNERQAKYDAKRNNRPLSYSPRLIMDTPEIVPDYEGFLGIPFSQLRAWREKGANECRYIAGPVTGADVPACGSPTRSGASYCPHCTERMKPLKLTQAERVASHHMGVRRHQRMLRRVA